MPEPYFGFYKESEPIMTDPISNNRPPGPTSLQRAVADKAERKSAGSVSLQNDTQAPEPSAAKQAGTDEVVLSNVMARAKEAPGFDKVKVESIKKAIQDGQYPLDPRRIAESFHALENMIRG